MLYITGMYLVTIWIYAQQFSLRELPISAVDNNDIQYTVLKLMRMGLETETTYLMLNTNMVYG